MILSKKSTQEKIFALSLTMTAVCIAFLAKIDICDWWWHLRAGKWMLAHKTLPFHDVFSWYASAHHLYWMSHEWGSEVIMASLDKVFGVNAPYVFVFTGVAVVFSVFCFLMREKLYRHPFLALFFVIMGTLATSLNPRPYILSNILMVLTIYILVQFSQRKNQKLIWGIIPLSFVLANIHGGASNLPYVLTLALLLSGIDKNRHWTKREALTIVTVIIGSILAILCNPHFIRMLSYPYANMGDSFMRSFIMEWQSPDIKNGVVPFILPVILVLTLICTKTKKNLFDVFLFLGFSYLFLSSVRFTFYFWAASGFIFFTYIDGIDFSVFDKPRKWLKEKRPALFEDDFKKKVIIGFLVIMSVYTIIIGGNWAHKTLNKPVSQSISDKGIVAIKRADVKHPYNSYNFGSYLIYRDIPVFIDGRADLYKGQVIKDGIHLDSMKVNPIPTIKKYDFDYFIIQPDDALAYYLKDTGYPLIYKDKTVVVFKNSLLGQN